jgi:hypothetical protein
MGAAVGAAVGVAVGVGVGTVAVLLVALMKVFGSVKPME